MEESSQEIFGFFGQLRFIKCLVHQLHPSIARALIELERHVPHAQARMAALLDVSLRPAKAADQEILQPLFSALQIRFRVHRAKNVVAGNLPVKPRDEALEAFLADLRVDIAVRNHRCSSYDRIMDGAPKSAYELAMERLKKKDADQGISGRSLTDDQKNEIAEVRKTYSARLAQEEILFKSKTQGHIDPESRRTLEDNYRRDVERLNHERDRKIEKIRGS